MITAARRPLENSPIMRRGLTFAMAGAAGLAVANIYYNQPMLGIMEADFPGGTVALVPTATQFGYALGLFALVPLGDLVERRLLIVSQFIVLAFSLVAAALAPSGTILLAASFLLGAASTVAQQIVPFAAHLASPDRRGAVVGTVMSGLLCGILLSRTLAGFVAAHEGWRAMFWLGVPLALIAGGAMALALPSSKPDSTSTYAGLMRSLGLLWRESRALRMASVTQALLFGGFTAFWSILALQLQSPQYAMGPEIAGLFGIVGAVGVLAALIAGRYADRSGPRKGIVAGTLLALASWLILGAEQSVLGLVLGCILLDFAVQAALVSNQHIVYSLRPEARARLNTIFMGTMFLGGAIAAGASSLAWEAMGWAGVSALGAGLAIAASALQLLKREV